MTFESFFEFISELIRVIKGESPSIFDKGLRACEDEGEAGEYAIKYALTNNNLKGEFKVMQNLYLPTKEGARTTEIDILMLHEKGIFVFESKNYSGSIYGEEDNLYWVQYLNRNSKNKFYNPIRQNETHIKALAEFLDMPIEKFVSFIVFSKRCELRKVPADKEKTFVLRRPNMLKKLRKLLANSEIAYSRAELEAIAEKLAVCTNVSEEDKQKHIDDIKTKCPYCGSELVERKGKYGSFYGCSTYPKCRYTRKIEEKE